MSSSVCPLTPEEEEISLLPVAILRKITLDGIIDPHRLHRLCLYDSNFRDKLCVNGNVKTNIWLIFWSRDISSRYPQVYHKEQIGEIAPWFSVAQLYLSLLDQVEHFYGVKQLFPRLIPYEILLSRKLQRIYDDVRISPMSLSRFEHDLTDILGSPTALNLPASPNNPSMVELEEIHYTKQGGLDITDLAFNTLIDFIILNRLPYLSTAYGSFCQYKPQVRAAQGANYYSCGALSEPFGGNNKYNYYYNLNYLMVLIKQQRWRQLVMLLNKIPYTSSELLHLRSNVIDHLSSQDRQILTQILTPIINY